MRAHEQRTATGARGGLEGAFEELVSENQQMVFNLAFRLLGDREEAMDLSQEVFLKAYRALPSFRGESAARTWLYRIVINAARNRYKWWKRRFRSRTVSLDADRGTGRPLGETFEDPDPGPERLARSAEIERRVQEGLGRLSPDHREVVVLRDLEGLSYQEIAEGLGISEGTVKSRIARARLELRCLLGDLI